jgi:1-deoxy-D-xylulose-5-phosphate reductoisomerase
LKRVAVLGCTGSIGTRTLDVVRHLGNRIRVVALAGGNNVRLLSEQIDEFHPRLYYALLPESVRAGGARRASLDEIARDDEVDTVVVATSGNAGLRPTIAALRSGKTVLLASKEVLVMAGALVMEAARDSGALMIPVDSEHNALWQCLRGENNGIGRLLLTASGGPFYRCPAARLDDITPEEALAHPVWSMGKKITIDSATLMNKGLEIIEAHWLFGVPFESIDVLVHPDCVVHSLVEFVDGCVKAQLSRPDMALPIQYALSYPDRVPGLGSPLSWDSMLTLTFEPVDMDRFPCLRLAREVGRAGMTYPAVLLGYFCEARYASQTLPPLCSKQSVPIDLRLRRNSTRSLPQKSGDGAL